MEIIDDFIELETSNEPDVLLPKSRKVPLGSGRLPSDFGLTDYLFLVYDCRLPKELKRTLMYFASRFNWKKRLPSFVSLVRASNDLDVGRKYLGENLQDLETWGWVSLKVNNKNQTYEVTLQIGREDETLRWKDIGGKNKQLAEQNLYG